MATATPPAPAASQDTRRIEYDKFIDQQIRRTRMTVKFVDLVSRVMTALAGLLAILLAAALVEHWLVPGGLSVFWRSVLWLGLLAAGAWFIWRQIAPLILQRISSAYAAQAIESHSPGLKNSLLNLLLFRQHRELVPDAVYRTVEEQAATGLATADIDAAVDRSGLIKIGYVLLAIVVVAGLYKVVSPKDPVATAGRVLMPWADIPVPTRVSIGEVEPGPIEVARGESIEVSAAVAGLDEGEKVVLRYSTEDAQTVDFPVEMLRRDGEYRFRAELPAEPPAGAAPGVQQPMTYFVEAGDARSKEFAIAVVDAPTIVLEQIEYDYPDYTRRADRLQPSDGEIRAIEGTRVTVRAQTNHPARKAGVDLGAEGKMDVPLRPLPDDALRVAGDFVLELDPETRTQPHDLYALRFTDTTGQRNRNPVHYRLEIIPDLPPEVEIIQPEEMEKEVRLGETVTIAIEARDPDYALARVTLFGRTAKGLAFEQPLFEGEHEGRFLTRHPFTPKAPEFAVGDVVEYWVEVEDNRAGEPNRAATEHRRLRVTEPPPVEGDHPALAEQGQGGQQPPQDQAGQAPPEQQPQGKEQQAGGGAAQQQQPQQGDSGQQDQQQPQQEGQQGGSEQEGRDGAAQPQDGQNGAGGQAQPGTEGQQRDSSPGAEGATPQTPTAEGPQNGDPAGRQPGGAGDQPTGDGQPPQDQGARQGGGDAAQGGQDSPAADEPPQPVPSDGSDDGTAMKRINQHFQNQTDGREPQPQDAGGPSADPERRETPQQQQPSEPQPERSRDAAAEQQADQQQTPSPDRPDGSAQEQQPNSQDQRGAQQEQTTGERSDQPPEAEGQRSQPNEAAPEPADGSGAEGEAGRDATQQQPQPSQEQPGDPSQASRPNQSQGPSEAGDQPGGSEGAPDPSEQPKPRDKVPQQGSTDAQQDDQEPPAPAQGKHESDSQGEQGGDRPGGGEEGGGQDAQREGTGSAGQHEPADEGVGSSSEKGQGDPSTAGEGADQQAGRQTGQAGDEAGRGSEERSGEGTQPGGQEAEGAQPQAQAPDADDPQGQDTQHRPPQEGDSPQQQGQPGQQRQDGRQQEGRQPGSVAGNPEMGGGDPGNSLPPPPAGGDAGPVGDEADLEYARKQTDLVLDRLENQLQEREVDPELLDKLGWSKDDMKKFVERWKNLKQAAQSDRSDASQAKRELDGALRALGFGRQQVSRGSGNTPMDDLQDLRDAPRIEIPAEFQDEAQAYTRGISRQE